LFKHEKTLLHPAKCDRPNPNYAQILQEGLGGSNGEMKAAMQYMAQSFRCTDPAIKDLMLDVAAEELGHMEIIATTINLLNGSELAGTSATVGSIEAQTVGGLSPMLADSSGYLWTAAYVNVTGDLVADLLADVAAEQRAKVVYEYLYRQIDDRGVRETIDFLLNREEAHNGLFREALNRVSATGSNLRYGVEHHARQYFDLSTPGRYFDNPQPTPVSFNAPARGRQSGPQYGTYREPGPAEPGPSGPGAYGAGSYGQGSYGQGSYGPGAGEQRRSSYETRTNETQTKH